MSTLVKVNHETNLYIDPENGFLHVREKDNRGKRRTKAVGQSVPLSHVQTLIQGDQKDVKNLLKKYRSSIQETHAEIVQGIIGVKSRVLCSDLWDLWIEEKKPTWRHDTWRDHESKGRLHLMPFFGNMKPHEVDEAAWERYISEKKKKSKGLRLKNHRQYMSEFLNHIFRNGFLSKPPALKNPDGEIPQKHVFTQSEIDRIFELVSDDLRLPVQMGLYMGMRPGEARKLRIDRIDFKKGQISLKAEDTKTKKARKVPIKSELIEPLKLKASKSTNDFLFPSPTGKNEPVGSFKTAWGNLMEKVGVDAGMHSLRHTCATRMASSNIAPSHACRILGMSLEIYDTVYCKPSESDLAKAIDKIDWGHE